MDHTQLSSDNVLMIGAVGLAVNQQDTTSAASTTSTSSTKNVEPTTPKSSATTSSSSPSSSPSSTVLRPVRPAPSPPIPPRSSTGAPPVVPPRKSLDSLGSSVTSADASPPPARPPKPLSSPGHITTHTSSPASPSQSTPPASPLPATKTSPPPKTPPPPPTSSSSSSPQTQPLPQPVDNAAKNEQEKIKQQKPGTTKAGMSTLRGILGSAMKNFTGGAQPSAEAKERQTKRNHVAKEILTTEETYVSKLKVLVEVYYIPLKAATENKHPPMTLEQVNAIFSEIVTIYNYNSHLLTSLQQRIKEGVAAPILGDLFISITDFLKTYTSYTNNYTNALETLQRVRKNPSVDALLQTFAQNPACGGLDLSSLLIMPIQRIPRYNLLLSELIKYSDTNTSEYQQLTNALDKMKKLATSINENKRESELLTRMFDIQSNLEGFKDGDFICPARKLIAEEVFEERVLKAGSGNRDSISKSHSLRYVLCTDILLRTKQKGKKLQVKEVFSLNSITFKDVQGEQMAIVSSTGETLLLKASTSDDAAATESKWKSMILTQQKTIKNNESSFSKRDSLQMYQ
ncbi:hypothetical protein SAMD00019534_087280 [Acytostelium subglobosum LB1]|uniref:hypothetical protein n=1 Tax=Acytostelium subglobosum LB1 TaxID=1410327 RepID=UPI000644BBDA|nr:hypothetical protein SAMD00019534_087280 [Acytostelium subglobosum LB1]GAM25553.1 hypothetical protein SAMD00019534_087280 [Acytostelium subglobosum LB1]|eukprot:XP_012751539.1 hypothetical protein SAMD00019534_087280 [Acytostelium subglobosum LB1]